MKKAIALLMVLALVGAFAFAQDAAAPAPAYSFTGSASLVWGVDLNTEKHGFNNTSAFELTVPLAVGSETKGGEGVYGMISAAEFDMSVIDGAFDWTDATITAKIIAGDFFVGIYGKPSFTYTSAQQIAPFLDADDAYDAAGTGLEPKVTTKGGVKVGYDTANYDFSVKVASIGDWGVTAAGTATTTYENYVADGTEITVAAGEYYLAGVPVGAAVTLTAGNLYTKVVTSTPATASADERYAIGFDFAVTPIAMITVSGGMFFYDSTLEAVTGTQYLGMSAKVVAKPLEGFTATVGMDAKNVDISVSTNKLEYDVKASLAYSFMEAKNSVSFDAYFNPTVYTTVTTDDQLDLGLKFTSASGFVPGLDFTLAGYAYALLMDPAPTMPEMAVAETVAYKYMMGDVNYVKPYQKAYYDFNDEMMYFNFGVEAKLITNTTFTLNYAAGTIGDLDNMDLAGAVNAFETDKGLLKFTTKISF